MGVAPRWPNSGVKFDYKELFIGVALYSVARCWVTTPTGVVYGGNTERFAVSMNDGVARATANADGYYARIYSNGGIESKVYYSKGATLGSIGPNDGSGTYMYWAAL